MEGSKRKWDQPDSEPAKAAAAPAIEVSAAAAAAARVAAQLAKAAANPDPSASMSSSLAGQGGSGGAGGPAIFTHKVDINDLRNRYLLAKPATAEEIRAETGCNVAVAGVWLMDRSRAKEHELPMHLVLTASTKASLDAGIARVDELIRTELGPLIEDRAKQKADWEARRPVRTKWPEEKVTVNLESIRNFNVRAKVVGPGGLFVKYIQQETGCKVQLKGRGSGFIDQETGAEADEPMFVSVAGPDEEQVRIARDLAADLLVVVREEHEKVRTGATMSTQQQYLNATGAYYAQQLQGELDPSAAYGQQQQVQQAYAQPPNPPKESDPPAVKEAYAAYWRAYGYDVNTPEFKQWAASQAAAQQQQQQQQQMQQQQPADMGGRYSAVPPPAGL